MKNLRNHLLVGTVLSLSTLGAARADDRSPSEPIAHHDRTMSDPVILSPETFANPPAAVRPKYRWWIPRGAAEMTELRREMQEMLEAGAGGAEISPFFHPGGAQQTGQGLKATGWESDRWHSLSTDLFAQATQLGFILDDTMSGLGSDVISVPASAAWQRPSVSKRAVAGYRVIRSNDTYDGSLPDVPVGPLSSALCAPANTGSTTIYPVLTGWLAAGNQVSIGSGATAELATVNSVQDGTWGCGKALRPLAPGDMRLFVSALAGGGGMDQSGIAYTQFNVGQRVKIGAGAAAETVTVQSLGEAPTGYAMQLVEAAPAGSGELQVSYAPNLYGTLPVRSGHYISIGNSSDAEMALVEDVKASPGRLTLRLRSPLKGSHAADPVQDLGTGINVSPLRSAHDVDVDVTVEPDGTQGVQLERPLAAAHPIGTAIQITPPKDIVAVLAYRCVNACEGDVKELDPKSVKDLTQDARDGRLDATDWRTKGDWVVFAQYMVADEPFQKGAFSPRGFDFPVDHLSNDGASAVTSYWTSKLALEKRGSRLRAPAPGPALFEDSLEMPFNQKWSKDFIAEWRARRGYDPTPFLPALFNTDQQARVPTGFFAQFMPKDRFRIDGVDAVRIAEDYRRTWSDLFRDRFVAPIAAWAGKQNLATRFQLYGSFPIDTSWASSVVTIPEGEALGFDDDINTYAIVASGAHMSGEVTVSNECCAARGRAYKDPLTGPNGTLGKVFRAFAGGVNQQVWHGYDYRAVETSSWPGYHAWSPEGGAPSYSEAFGSRLPAWQSGAVRAVNDAIARSSLVLRQGKPSVDLAVYHHVFGRGVFQGPEAPAIQNSGPLARAGFTLGFISPEYLSGSTQKVWQKGQFFPDKAQYKALLFDRQETVTIEAANAIVALAERGARLVFIGDLPARAYGLDPTGANDAQIAKAMAKLRDLSRVASNVQIVADEQAAVAALRKAGVAPTAQTDAPNAVTTVKRRDGKRSFYYLYNDADRPLSANWTFEGNGPPSILDVWSGKILPSAKYIDTGRSVSLPLSVGAKSVLIVGLGLTKSDTDHVIATENGHVFYQSGPIEARGSGGKVHYRTARGHTGYVNLGNADSSCTLNSWKITLDEFRAGPGAVNHRAWETVKIRHMDQQEIQAGSSGVLPPWGALGALRTSGIAEYKTSIDLPQLTWGKDRGAYLDLGNVLGTPSVFINDQAVAFDLQSPRHIDIGNLLQSGTNTIKIVIASNLANAIDGSEIADGLIGPITLSPCGWTKLTNE